MVKAIAARRQVLRRGLLKSDKTGESPRALYQPGGPQRAVVECSTRAVVSELDSWVGPDRCEP